MDPLTKRTMDIYVDKVIHRYAPNKRAYIRANLDRENTYELINECRANDITKSQTYNVVQEKINDKSLMLHPSTPKLDETLQRYLSRADREKLRDTSVIDVHKAVKRMTKEGKSPDEIKREIQKGIDRGDYKIGWIGKLGYSLLDAASYARHPFSSFKRSTANAMGFKRQSGDLATYEQMEETQERLGNRAPGRRLEAIRDLKDTQIAIDLAQLMKSKDMISKGKYYAIESNAKSTIRRLKNYVTHSLDIGLEALRRKTKVYKTEDKKDLEKIVDEEEPQHSMAAAILIFIGISTFIIALINPSLTGYTIVSSGTAVPSGYIMGIGVSLLGWLYYKTKR